MTPHDIREGRVECAREKRRDSWVLYLTGAFVAIAVCVFAFAIYRHRTAETSVATDPPTIESSATTEADTTSQDETTSATIPHPGNFRVVRIIDGDTLVAIGADQLELTVRLRGIDAPERDQPHGHQATNALISITESKEINMANVAKGKYGRYVADIFVNGLSVNQEMVRRGHAWRDQKDPLGTELSKIENTARESQLGLWEQPTPIAPWIWREKQKR